MKKQTLQQPASAGIPVAPDRYCDIVMKGGVTSGIVYPHAVCELAEKFRFVNIGGTSAGAIAAAVTAAAEYRRANGDVRGFTEEVVRLPKLLSERLPGGSTKLLSLFQPNDSTRAIFNALIHLMRSKGVWRIPLAIVGVFSIIPGIAWPCLLLLLVSVLLMWVIPMLTPVPIALLLLLVLSLVAVGTLVFTLVACGKKIVSAVAGNMFGLCTGCSSKGSRQDVPSLTEWLTEFIDRTAGKQESDPPLTFGDLWGVGGEGTSGKQRINLQMMTTNLTQGRPYRLPFEQQDLYWDPSEFRKLFPERIVRWMAEHGKPYSDGVRYRLPEAKELPVIVAVRMSLSFPLLISAVPLWAVDYSRLSNQKLEKEGKPFELERCWFSDGGICSNFPVHFFDSPLPRWPTFAINLRPFHPDYKPQADQRKNIWMPKTNGEGRLEQWVRFDSGSDWSKLFGFVMNIIDTMQNWVDNTQLKIPGYRDRVAHVYLTLDEGGLNLEMKHAAISRISERGRFAGELLKDRFTDTIPDCVLNWDNHRWVRYRSTMTLLEKFLHDVAKSYTCAFPDGAKTYADLVARESEDPPKCYTWDSGQKEFAEEIGRRLMNLVTTWDGFHQEFLDGAPSPVPELRIRPKL